MNTTLTEHTTDEIEELRKDYYDEYYPIPRVEKAIFKYLDEDYYAGRDNVFFSVYKKENDWFVNQKDIEEEITKMFGLTLPERIKMGPGEDDYIEPARNPIPGRVIHKWIVHHQKIYDKEEQLRPLKEHANPKLLNRFIKDFWPDHRSQLYSNLYNTYHPSAYAESFNRPGGMFEDALETLADAVHEGKKLGLVDSSVDWSDTIHYDTGEDGIKRYGEGGGEIKRLIDDDGIPTLNDQLEIMDNTNLDWVHAILLFDVYEEIVDEFKHYCGENGIDESGMGKCMDEFPPDARGEMVNGTLKQDYYTLYNFMRELERAGIPVTDYLKDPTYPNIIKLVDTGASDYNPEGGERISMPDLDQDEIDAEEIAMDVPERLGEQDITDSDITDDEIKNLETQIEIDKESIKDLEKDLKDTSKKEFKAFGKTKRFGYEDDEDKGTVIGIGRDASAFNETELVEQDPEGEENQQQSNWPEWNPEFELDDTTKNLEKTIKKTNIEIKKDDLSRKEKRLKDLQAKGVKIKQTQSTSSMGADNKTSMGGDETTATGPISIKKIVSITEHGDAEVNYDNEEYVDNSPFTRKEVIILKALHRDLSRSELQQLSDETPESYGGGTGQKFWNIMKLFGIEYSRQVEEATRASKYAKWALDNWTEEGDYDNIENPIKVPLKWYQVDREESGSQIEYKDGTTEVLGFDDDDAGERADYDFYSWGGEMETNDYGDYEQYDSDIVGTEFLRLDERIAKILREESGKNVETIQAKKEDFNKLMYSVLRRVRQIPLDKTISPARIQELLSEDGVKFTLDGGADLNEKIHREYNRVRFYEYSQQLLKSSHSKGVRGHYFEGLLAGLFNGQVVSPLEGEMTDPKEDVLINGINYSAKLVRAQDKRWGTSSLLGGFKQALIQRLVDRDVEVPDELLKRKLEEKYLNDLIELFPEGDPDREHFRIRHLELFLKDQNIDRKYKQITLEHAFTSKSEEEIGTDLHWIFGLIWGANETFEGEDLPTTNLRYYLIDTDSLIAGILDGNIHYIKGRNIREIRIAEESMIKANGASSNSIVFPVVTRQDLESLLYDEDSEEMVYKVMGIFKDFKPGTEKYIHHKIADVIADNPQEFIKKLQDLFPNKGITEETLYKLVEDLDPALKYSIDQQHRTNPEVRDELLQSIEDEEHEGEYHLNPETDSPALDVPPIKIAQKFSDVNGYGNIKFDMQGGNGIAYFTDKNLVIKLTADDSEYFTANKLVGTDNEYIVKVIESAKIKTSHSNYPIFVIVEEALPMTEEMEKIWSQCCCGVDSPIHIDYLEEPALVLPPVSSQDKCLPIYDNIIGIQKNFAEYGIIWSDIGIDNMGIKNGKLVVVDLGETRGQGSVESKTVTLEHINIRPLTSKQIKKQLVLI